MKKKLFFLFLSVGAAVAFIFVTGFKKEEKLHFNLSLNEEYLDMVQSKNSDFKKDTDEKFGSNTKETKINLSIDNIVEVKSFSDFTENTADAKGVIKTPSGNFAFRSTGLLYKMILSDNKTIYYGDFQGTINNKVKEDVVNISMRYNPDTEETDISFVSGIVYETAILPFGNPFLFDDDLDLIVEKRKKYGKVEWDIWKIKL